MGVRHQAKKLLRKGGKSLKKHRRYLTGEAIRKGLQAAKHISTGRGKAYALRTANQAIRRGGRAAAKYAGTENLLRGRLI
jgi:hypothetical protein